MSATSFFGGAFFGGEFFNNSTPPVLQRPPEQPVRFANNGMKDMGQMLALAMDEIDSEF